MKDLDCITFVEVRYRKSAFGHAAETVTGQNKKIVKAANMWLLEDGYRYIQPKSVLMSLQYTITDSTLNGLKRNKSRIKDAR